MTDLKEKTVRYGADVPDETARRQGQAENPEAARHSGRTSAPMEPIRTGGAAPRDPQPAKTEKNRPTDAEDKAIDKNLDKALEGTFPASDPVDLTPKEEPMKPAPVDETPKEMRKAHEEQEEARKRALRRGTTIEDAAE